MQWTNDRIGILFISHLENYIHLNQLFIMILVSYLEDNVSNYLNGIAELFSLYVCKLMKYMYNVHMCSVTAEMSFAIDYIATQLM